MSGTTLGYDQPRSALFRPRGGADEPCCRCCRAGGRWEEGPWGYEALVARARPRALDPAAREAALKALRPLLENLVKSAASHPNGLDEEEENLLEAIRDWVGRLFVETLK